MALTTLAAIQADVLDRADMDNGGPVSASQVVQRINAAIGVVYDAIAKVRGDEYFEVDSIFTTGPGTQDYALAIDFLKISNGGVWWITGDGLNVQISKFPANEGMSQVYGTGWTYQPYLRTAPVRYRLRKGNGTETARIRFVPTPQASHTVVVKYIARPVLLVNPSDPWDGYDGFEEAVKWHAAASCKAKQEADTTFEVGMFNTEMGRLLENVDRDNSAPPEVQWVDPIHSWESDR